MKRIAAVIFDMDGVLADTEPLHRAAEIETYKQAGITITEEKLKTYAGLPDRMTFGEVLKIYGGDPARAEELFEWKYARAMPQVLKQHGITAIEGALDIVREAAEHFPCAVASSSPHRFIDLTLQTLKLHDFLPVRVSSDDLSQADLVVERMADILPILKKST